MTMSTRYDPEKHHRRSIRLKAFDYKQTAGYFVTICTRNGDCLFGTIDNNEQQLNDAGRLAENLWSGLPARFPGVSIDAFVVMPNHVHGIILVGAAIHCALSHAPQGRDKSRPYTGGNCAGL
jgi:putative transposase